jgi:hypothetical protein
MKVLQVISLIVLFAFVGCATTNDRIPASEINNVQAREQQQERYIYGDAAFSREGAP